MRDLKFVLMVLVMIAGATGLAAADEAHLMRHADIHWDWVVFTYEGDLWLAPATGGEARRVTRHPGVETLAKFSPDGSQIAFTAGYDGGSDVYVMDARGGVPKRLTYHPASDRVLGWTPDGSAVLFRSRREYPDSAERLYTVPAAGGTPQLLPVDRAGLASLSPDGSMLAYNRITREDRTWKRHQGGTAQDLWLGSLAEGDFHRITSWEGTDAFPMWHEDGIYFISDRNAGTLNLFRYDVTTGDTVQLTSYTDYDVKYPSIGPGAIVYQYAESLYRYDLASGENRRIEISLRSDHVATRPYLAAADEFTGAFRLDPAGEVLYLVSRGEILRLPVDEGEARNLSASSGSREKNVAVSADGSRLAFYSDRSGEEELYVMDSAGGEWRQLTDYGGGFHLQPVFSPDGRYLLYSDKKMQLNLIEVESGERTVLDHGEVDDGWYRWGIQDYTFSPDGRFIAYTKLERSLNESLFLFDLKERSIIRVTGEESEDWSPSFSPDGSLLYFLSRRTLDPVMGSWDQNHVFLKGTRPYVVLLTAGTPSPFAPKEGEDDAADDDAAVTVRVDRDGLTRRVLAVDGIEAGDYDRLEATDKGFLMLSRTELTWLKYQQVTDTSSESFDLLSYELAEKEAKTVMSGVSNYHLSGDLEKMVYRGGGGFGVAAVGAEASVGDGSVDLGDVKIRVDKLAEFRQIFDEAWRVQRDFFYDPGMHGVDWPAVGEKYRRFVSSCGNRSDLNYLIGEMIGELNAGHTYIGGGDYEPGGERVAVGLLGADFAASEGAKHHRITHIVHGTSWNPDERSPLEEPGCTAVEGMYLIAVDGREVTASENVFAPLLDTVGKRIKIELSAADDGSSPVICEVEPVASEDSLRYREWVEANRARVDEASGGAIGYLHLPDMMTAGLQEFARGYYHQYFKKGFIIDDRHNKGGFVGDQIIDRLERRVWAMTKPREGMPIPNPERAFHGHLAVLINEDTGSNGEYFAEAIKLKGLAPLIGKRTWGGAVGIEPHQELLDGAVTTPPQFAPYGLDGRWLIEGRGVEPDIEVDYPPAAALAGEDPQLERAVELLMQQMEEDPMQIPPPPPYPDKSK